MTGNLSGICRVGKRLTASGLPSVILKKKRSAELIAFSLPELAPLFRQMQLVASEIIGPGQIRGAAQKGSKLVDRPDIVMLCFLAKASDHHIINHPLAQRADGGRLRDWQMLLGTRIAFNGSVLLRG
jgi:hypothetical protein